MKFKPRMIVCLLLVLLLLGTNGAAAQALPPAGFTYQGQLQDGAGNPLTATCDFTFRLWDADSDGSQVGADSPAPGISVSGGYFTAPVNAAGEFGANAFPGEGRWLEVSVRCPGGSGPYTTLAPRQPLTATPYASYAPQAGSAPWSGLSGLPAGFADGTDDGLTSVSWTDIASRPAGLDDGDDNTTYTAGSGLRLASGEFSLLAAYQLPQSCTGGQVPKWNALGTRWMCANDDSGGDISAVTAGSGLSGGGSSGDVTLDVDFAGSGSAETAARSDHGHWGASWSGSGIGLTLSGGSTGLSASGSSYGVSAQSSASNGYGMRGASWATTGISIGVIGQSASPEGRGVSGQANANSGNAYGVYGQTLSPDGAGVYGLAAVASGASYGVYGLTNSSEGHGVYGYADSTSGATFGVYGQAASANGRGVFGFVTATSGYAYGVEGLSASIDGRGVVGRVTATTGANYGLYGESASAAGSGVYGLANQTNGSTHGVYGEAVSSNGFGVYGKAPTYGLFAMATATTGNTYGIQGQAASTDGRGVQGYATATSGTTTGVFGMVQSPDGRGVYGVNYATSGTNYGVYGVTYSNQGYGVAGQGTVYGVYGKATDGYNGVSYGVYGESTDATHGRGVMGFSPHIGVYGQTSGSGEWDAGIQGVGLARGVAGYTMATSGEAYAVFGQTESNGGMGVYGIAHSRAGYGVYGYADAASGTTYGVYGQADSGSGYGGYFYNNSGGVGLRAESSTGNHIEAWNGTDREFYVSQSGNVYADGTYTSPAADFAEMLPAVQGLEPGDVLAIGPQGKLVLSTQAYQSNVAGVYSTRPAFLGGSEEAAAAEKVPLAVVGIVPVKVSAENGAIQPGDLLVASNTPGHAMRADETAANGVIVGKALEGLDSGTGVILMLVTLQ